MILSADFKLALNYRDAWRMFREDLLTVHPNTMIDPVEQHAMGPGDDDGILTEILVYVSPRESIRVVRYGDAKDTFWVQVRELDEIGGHMVTHQSLVESSGVLIVETAGMLQKRTQLLTSSVSYWIAALQSLRMQCCQLHTRGVK